MPALRRPPTPLLVLVACAWLLLVDPPSVADSAGTAPGASASPAGGAPFEGFGVSGAWWARDTGRLPTVTRDRIAGLLFSPSGLRLSMYRYNIGGGGWVAQRARFAPGFLRSDGSYNWSADAAGRDMLARAAAMGVPRLVAFANAAPPEFTSNGLGCAGTLRADRVAEYASYLSRVVVHFAAAGARFDLVSPMNEPDSAFSSCTQEGMAVPVALRGPLIDALQAALARRGSSAGVLADESGTAGGLLSESPGWVDARPRVLAYHAYDNPSLQRLQQVAALSGNVGRPAYMSEVCCLVDGHFRQGFHPRMLGALWMAHAIWRNLAVGGASSFSWWVALSPELGCDARLSSCGTRSNGLGWDDGLVYYDRDYRSDGNRRLVLTKRHWAYAQFTRWIRPGMAPHAVTGDTGGARVLVYTGRGRTVVVAIAPRHLVTSLSLGLPWLGSATASVTQTSRLLSDAPLQPLPVDAGTLSAQLPAGSVTTFVIPG